jgi:hypothetical protein
VRARERRTRSRLSRRRPRATEAQPDIRRSLESTQKGLETLLASLERSSLKDAADPYRDMQLVLVQQRLWSRNHGRDDLEPLWSQIAETARTVHEILAAFAVVMGELGDLDRIEPGPSGEIRRPGDDELELGRLLAGGRVSAATLRHRLPWPNDARRRRLDELVTRGVLERRGWGPTLSYRLAEPVRERLAGALSDALAAARPPQGT